MFLGARHTEPPTTSSRPVWIVAAIVSGIIFVGAALAFVFTRYAKRRQYLRVGELDPYLTRQELFKRRKMTAADRYREEEERRRHMIRKSLASRSSLGSRASTHSARSGSSAETVNRIHQEVAEMERREPRLKDDWKEWEARERQERTVGGGRHPAVEEAGDVPILTIPTPAKHRSQGRSILPSSPPAPARHPGRRSPS
ncbi:hypothetical protein BT67DRAFT_380359 [Trichocladium antarcticum]|uniref:Uncharacterized protein n=1 Tax=Trichocladium antarcticum TaxID=1450529 RepID=A0AAN6UJJ2_9PEZI|nr:hypothetical protein BT67DRAFT_380359 [Trichocladium antarcticum]